MAEKPRVTKVDYIPCPKCGEPNHPNLTWCEKCGKLLASAPSGGEWETWVLLGVITVSLAGSVLPAWQLAGEDDVFCPGILGVVGGCIVLLIRLKGARRPDWVSLIALCVILVSAAVLIFLLLPSLLSDLGASHGGFWQWVEGDWILKLPTAVATLGYFVLLVRLLERALR